MKKNKRVIALIMVVLLFCSTFMTDINVMAEEYDAKTETQINEENSKNVETQANEDSDTKNDSLKKEDTEVSTGDETVTDSDTQTKVTEEENQDNLQTEQEDQKKENKLNSVLEKCNDKEDFKIKGDLLTSYIYSIKKGDSSFTTVNFFSEDGEEVTIPLDENKTPSENVQSYYKKYNKLKKSEESAIEQLEKNSDELEYLNSVLTNIENCESYTEIDDIKEELISTGYVRKRKANGKNNKKAKPSKPLHYISSDGIDIFVGKNNIQNDNLSLKFANKNHMWLHTKNIPGSHVIVCSNDVPDNTLVEAATLAAYYSKAKESSKVDVDYTLVKNLKKPNGAKPGMVIYHTNYTMTVDPSDIKSLNLERK